MKFKSMSLLMVLTAFAQAKTFSASDEVEAIAHAKEKGLPLAYINKK